jgi:tetratricopeptide (TPR) repeat protein
VASVAKPPEPKVPEPSADVLSEMVLDLEESLGDFVPANEPATTPVASAAAKPVPAPIASKSPVPHPVEIPVAASNGMRDAESTSVLSDILSELQEDLGEDTVEAEDPETHYNLGIAFKEMGLLDEAIGELQKVCHALEHGNSFSQPVKAYTWLAQCLVDKGVPEAAVRWYEKALTLPGLDHTSRCAIYYDLGSAYEASGDKKSALANFMEVYSSNIDFRDVATRIKVLKS